MGRNEPQFGRFQGGLGQVHTFVVLGHGELHYQNGVLGGQAQHGQQPDLKIDVIRKPSPHGGHDSANGPQWQGPA